MVRLVTCGEAPLLSLHFHFSFEHPFLATGQCTNWVTSRKSRIKILVEDEPFFCAAYSYCPAVPSTFNNYCYKAQSPWQASTLLEILPVTGELQLRPASTWPQHGLSMPQHGLNMASTRTQPGLNMASTGPQPGLNRAMKPKVPGRPQQFFFPESLADASIPMAGRLKQGQSLIPAKEKVSHPTDSRQVY